METFWILDAKWVKEHPVYIHCFNKWKDEDVDPKKWEISIGTKKSTTFLVLLEKRGRL